MADDIVGISWVSQNYMNGEYTNDTDHNRKFEDVAQASHPSGETGA